jgi:hypothetical protein
MSQARKNSKLKPEEKSAQTQPVNKPAGPGFAHFIFKDARQRNLLLITLLVNALLFAIYKYYYPIPDFFSDSYGYVLSAAQELEVFYRPLGYSHFLSFLHNFSASSTFVVAVHYFLLTGASLFCFFSVDYLYGYRHKGIRIVVWALLTFNFLFLPLANQVASDSLFTALAIIWFTLLLWVLRRGNWAVLVLQAVILLFAFEVRYNSSLLSPRSLYRLPDSRK